MIPSTKKRLTIGLLSENAQYASEALMTQGVAAAAEEADVNFIYLGYLGMLEGVEVSRFESAEESDIRLLAKHEKLRQLIEQFEIDGLLLIGWSVDFREGRILSFRAAFPNLPMFSIGMKLEDDSIPYSWVSGAPYVEEITHHLIQQHGRRRIALIEPWSRDDRQVGYLAAMAAAGLTTDQLIVTNSELSGIQTLHDRTRRALELLLDGDRGPIDAIIAMSATEGKLLIDYLAERGLHAPEDIAIVCYEDDFGLEFTRPPITSVPYPYEDIGRASAAKLIRMLQGEPVGISEEISTRVMYRDSCGCVNRLAHADDLLLESTSPAHNAEEAALLLRREFPSSRIPFEKLVQLFDEAVSTRRPSLFLGELRKSLIHVDLSTSTEALRSIFDRMRILILTSYDRHSSAWSFADELWLSAAYILELKLHSSKSQHFLVKDQLADTLRFMGSMLLSSYKIPQILKLLNDYLGWLDIPTLYLFQHLDGEDRLIMGFHEYHTRDDLSDPPQDVGTAYRSYRDLKDKQFAIMLIPLHIHAEPVGFAWMEFGNKTSLTLLAISEYVKTAMKGANLLKESQMLIDQLVVENKLRRERERQLAALVETDALTGLYNRRYFYEVLQQAVTRKDAFATLFIDIDGFKGVNDTYGHDVGDELLIQIATRIQSNLKPFTCGLSREEPEHQSDQAAIFRLGGDEFTALLCQYDPDELTPIVERLIQSVRMPYSIAGNDFRISCSIGISRYPYDSSSVTELLKQADTAMYAAKSVKNTYVFHS